MVSASGFVGPDSFFVRASVSRGHDLWAPSRCVGPGCTPQHPSWNPKTCKSVPPPPHPPYHLSRNVQAFETLSVISADDGKRFKRLEG